MGWVSLFVVDVLFRRNEEVDMESKSIAFKFSLTHPKLIFLITSF